MQPKMKYDLVTSGVVCIVGDKTLKKATVTYSIEYEIEASCLF